jgi:hypothetical protein
MNGRQDQIVLVELRAAGFGAAGIGWVQCQLGQKALAGDVTGGNLLELVEICVRRLGTKSSQTLRWRGLDSNF